MKIGFKRSDKFIAEQQAKGNDCFWDGWTMVFFRPHRGGFRGGGVKRDGRWGFLTRVEVDDKGFWNLPPQLVV